VAVRGPAARRDEHGGMDGHAPVYLLIATMYVLGAAWIAAVVGLGAYLVRDYRRDRQGRG
jgi:hypothetical protein